MVRVSCSSLKATMSEGLVEAIGQLGFTYIDTPRLVRVVYEGEDRALAESLVGLFQTEADHEITAIFPKKS